MVDELTGAAHTFSHAAKEIPDLYYEAEVFRDAVFQYVLWAWIVPAGFTALVCAIFYLLYKIVTD